MTARDKGRQQRCRFVIDNKLMLKKMKLLSPFLGFISTLFPDFCKYFPLVILEMVLGFFFMSALCMHFCPGGLTSKLQ